jgi:predicted phage baseplate assembly protein
VDRPSRTTLFFKDPLKYCYDPATVRLFGNVVAASHGESYEEVLGNGLGGEQHPSFVLSRRPVSRLQEASRPDVEPQLWITVNGDPWELVRSFFGKGPSRRAFELTADDGGMPVVVFGSGRVGARLPTGRENVKATYRIGTGAAGNVSQDRLKLAVDHPLGVREVSNSRAFGGADPDPPDRVRSRAPISTVALGRLVSAVDHSCAAKAEPGVAKAAATIVARGSREFVVVSILNDGVAPTKVEGPPGTSLQTRLMERADGGASILVVPGVLSPLLVRATIKTRRRAFLDDVRSALLALLCFDQREIGQPAYASQALAAIQGVRGVDYASLTAFCRFTAEPLAHPIFEYSIDAFGGGLDDAGVPRGGEMLLIQPHIQDSIVLDIA